MNNALAGYSLPVPQKATAYKWQQDALDCISYLEKPEKSQIFRWAKLKETKLKASINYMKEKNIRSMGYLITLMNL